MIHFKEIGQKVQPEDVLLSINGNSGYEKLLRVQNTVTFDKNNMNF